MAEEDGRIVGHVLFTPTIIEGEGKSLVGTGLAPLAVLPQYQGKGIGSALVRAGLDEMRAAGELFVVVIGHPGYYPKFGFERGSKHGIRCEYGEVPDEAFMIVVFDEGRMQGVTGVAKERPELAPAM